VSTKGLHWGQKSDRLYAAIVERGRQLVASIDVPGGEIRRLVMGERHVGKFALARNRLVFGVESPEALVEVHSTNLAGGDEITHTAFNSWASNRVFPSVQVRQFQVPDGSGGTEAVEGWLLLPRDAPRPYPLFVDVHGGPASTVLLKYDAHPHWPVLISRGWAILAMNAVGSSSYGCEFAERLRGRWGELDLPQHLAAIDTLKQEKLVDEDRIAISGKSYGGYMAAWAPAQAPVFRAAIVMAPVIDMETHYATSDSGYHSDAYSMKTEPDGAREKYTSLSPLRYSKKIVTPTLILQGGEDERCPVCQGEMLFGSIMRHTKTPAELVVYPGGSHTMFESGTPSHRLDVTQRVVDWVERWTAPPG
jgi:dipeptidyl aminopeptidase/acylaminoacyl peptidase